MTTPKTPRPADSERTARAADFRRRVAATGLNPTEFARRAGLTRNVYYNLSIGQRPNDDQRRRIDEVFAEFKV